MGVLSRGMRLGVFALLLGAAALMHVRVGALESGFGAFEDEPAHLVTALMIKDWIVAGLHDGQVWLEPRGFAENYYVHYPKVAVGQWPPVFHALLAIWMVIFGTSKVAIISLLTLMTAVTAYAVFALVRRPLGTAAGLVAAFLFLNVPVVQLCSASAMTELPLSLFSLGALLAFGRFLDSREARWAWYFAAAAAMTVLTKGSGLALALVPPVSIAMTGRWGLLRSPALWFSGVAVALVTGPWYLLTVASTQESWGGGSSPSWAYVRFAADLYSGWIVLLAGAVAIPLALVGAWWGVAISRKQRTQGGVWAVLATWIPALLLLHLVIPSSVEERHLSVLAPAWIVFSALGSAWLARAAAGTWKPETASAAGVIALGLLALLGQGERTPKNHRGWDTAGSTLVDTIPGNPSRMLVASDPTGEGLFVVGAALADQVRPDAARPRALVLRGSKSLCQASWSGRDYAPRFQDVSDLERWLESVGVGLIVLDLSTEGTRHWYEHCEQLRAVVSADGSAWEEVGQWDLIRSGLVSPGCLHAYRRDGWRQLPAPPISLDESRGEGSESEIPFISPGR